MKRTRCGTETREDNSVYTCDLPSGYVHGFAASPIAFISHVRKQVVIQFLSIDRQQPI